MIVPVAGYSCPSRVQGRKPERVSANIFRKKNNKLFLGNLNLNTHRNLIQQTWKKMKVKFLSNKFKREKVSDR